MLMQTASLFYVLPSFKWKVSSETYRRVGAQIPLCERMLTFALGDAGILFISHLLGFHALHGKSKCGQTQDDAEGS